MGYRELIDALYKGCEEKAMAIRAEAETEAAGIRKDAEIRIERIKEKCNHAMLTEIKKQRDEIIRETKKKAMALRLEAEKELTGRFYEAALSALNILRGEDYKDVFASLVKEIPSHPWRIVKVSLEDIGLAGEYFKDSEIIPDRGISGGIEVASQDGKICISNTFEKRLERKWMDILPELIKDVTD